jgi:hypothetical protein
MQMGMVGDREEGSSQDEQYPSNEMVPRSPQKIFDEIAALDLESAEILPGMPRLI